MNRVTIEYGSELLSDRGSVRVEVTSPTRIAVSDVDHYAQRIWALLEPEKGPERPLKVE